MRRTLIARVTCFFAFMIIALPAFAQQRGNFKPAEELPGDRTLLQVTERARPDSRRPIDRQIADRDITYREIEAQQTEIPPSQKAQIAQNQLVSAISDEEKGAAKESLSKALEECFDVDIKNREAQLESIRQRLAEMEAQLKKRVEGKDEIVRLRLQVLVNNASGLGWPDASGNSFGSQSSTRFAPLQNSRSVLDAKRQTISEIRLNDRYQDRRNDIQRE